MRLLLIICFFCIAGITRSQQLLPYKNPALSTSLRVQDLLKRMTPEEKFRQLFMVAGDLGTNPDLFKTGLFGFQVNTTLRKDNDKILDYAAGKDAKQLAEKINSIQQYFIEHTRLGIPIIAYDEALHGLVRNGSTAFPQSIALAATWDTLLVHKIATAIAEETGARGIRQILSPVVNLATDVRWGRVEETYGEDPYLSAAIAVAYVGAFERKNIITTPKHFVVNHGAGGRDSYPVYKNELELETTYFVPFKSCINLGGSRSIMTAYNSLDGRPCTANDWLLNKKLKKEWGFSGFVISDAAATGGANVLHFTARDYEDAGKQSIENGLDVIFQTGMDSYDLFKRPFLEGTVDAEKLNSAVARVLKAKFELGLFENPYIDVNTDKKVNYAAHRNLSNEAAQKSIVLLKNNPTKILPLQQGYKNIAIIGTDALEARLGGYSGLGNDKINILDGLRQYYGKTKNFYYAPGCGREKISCTPVPAVNLFHLQNGVQIPGLDAAYYNNIKMEGEPVLHRKDQQINFQWTLFGPDPKIQFDFFSVRWKGKISAPLTGNYKIGIEGNDGYRLYVNGKLLLDAWQESSFHTRLADFHFDKNKIYDLLVEYKEASGNAIFKLVWNIGVQEDGMSRMETAVQLAKKSDMSIIVAGIKEGEFQDRSSLALPGNQELLIKKIAATGKPVVVLLVGGSAVTMDNWIDKVAAIVQVWYPGETGGKAVAEILSGKINPSGKLPITFPKSEGQLPLTYNHLPTGRGDDYLDGTGQALFPFGYGLSYTSFEYKNLRCSKTMKVMDTILLYCTIKNTGNYPGEEVVQLYIRDEIATIAQPVKALKGFQRIVLEPGEEKEISFKVTPEMLSLVNEKMEKLVEPGEFRMMIGSSSKDIRLRTIVTVE